jgi:hypothetical protein
MSDANSSEPGLFAGYWTEEQFANERNLSIRTLRIERQSGQGPAFIVDRRRIYYPVATAREWLAQKMNKPVREPSRPVRKRILEHA